MAKVKIREFNPGQIENNNDYIPVALNSGTTVKVPYSAFASAILTNSLVEGTGITISENQNDFYSVTISAVAPTIDPTTKHWIIGETDTGVVAEGQDGAQGQQGVAGDDGASIFFTVENITGGHSVTISSTDTSVSDRTFNVMDGINGSDGDSISATTTAIAGGHRVTITHTDTSKIDQSFDVMDGTEIIQTTSDNRQVTLLVSGWSGESAPYTQTVTYSGMTALVVPEIGVVISDTVATGLEQQKQWSNITRAVSGTDSITFYCYKTKPTIDLTANVKVV